MKFIFIFTLLMTFGLTLSGQSYFSLPKIQDETSSKHSIGIAIGRLREWRFKNVDSQFYTPNNGTSLALNYNYQIASYWTIQMLIHFDRVREQDLRKIFFNNTYNLTLARNLLKERDNEIRVFLGFAFIDEIGYDVSHPGTNGPNLQVSFINIRKYHSPYTSFGIEYLTSLSKQVSIGFRLNTYYDLINFGRTDILGFIKMRLSKKPHKGYSIK
ncbi:hypothetical protein [Roseivirga sp.]|uniref:hypothetical protein n=1 Tax=Roseivirga sp. TaxID=1964215 RepID=UPI003B526B97